jgi:hypothetical protein
MFIRLIAFSLIVLVASLAAHPAVAQRNFSSRQAPEVLAPPRVGGTGGLHSGRTNGTGGLKRGRVAGTGGLRGPLTDRVDDLAGPGDVRGDRAPIYKRRVN